VGQNRYPTALPLSRSVAGLSFFATSTNDHHADKIPTIGAGIGKDVFHLLAIDADSWRVRRKVIKRLSVVPDATSEPHVTSADFASYS
jgi:hypothetical protein